RPPGPQPLAAVVTDRGVLDQVNERVERPRIRKLPHARRSLFGAPKKGGRPLRDGLLLRLSNRDQYLATGKPEGATDAGREAGAIELEGSLLGSLLGLVLGLLLAGA